MKKRYKKEAYLLDDGILLHGYKDKRGFHPDKRLPCGFGLQKIHKKDVGKIIFYSFTKAKERLGDVSFAGGQARVAIDDGMAVTKICASIGDYYWWHKTDTLCTKDNVNDLIEECMSEKGIKLMKTDIKYILSSEFTKGIFGILIK